MAAYDCSKCPGYCCSYPNIAIEKSDVARLARHFGVTLEVAARRFTRQAHGRKWVLRRKKDPHFGRICRFFDTERRNCTIYEARPKLCRSYPNEPKCGYWEFLSWERRQQNDPEFVAKTDSSDWP